MPPTPVDRQVTLRDGSRLALRVWNPATEPCGTIVIAHGLGEHAGRYTALAGDLTAEGWEVHAPDLHGHGRSPGPRGVIPRPDAIRDDILAALSFARATSASPVVLLGHSMGGAFAATALLHDPAAADALVLSSPALRADLSVMQRMVMNTMRHLAPDLVVGNGLNPHYLSHDRAVVDAYVNDPLVHDRVSSRLAYAIMTAGQTTRAAAAAWKTPTLLLYAGDDHLVNPRGSDEFASAAPRSLVTTRRFDALYHEIFNETERTGPINVLLEWLRTRSH